MFIKIFVTSCDRALKQTKSYKDPWIDGWDTVQGMKMVNQKLPVDCQRYLKYFIDFDNLWHAFTHVNTKKKTFKEQPLK